MSESNNVVGEVMERCEQDSNLDFIEELRKVVKNPALLDDIARRRDRLHSRMVKAFDEDTEIRATEETGASITDYHENVVMPIFAAIINELVGIEAELALCKSEAEADPSGGTSSAGS